MSYLCSEVQTTLEIGKIPWANAYLKASFFFWRAGQAMEKGERGVLQSIILQVLLAQKDSHIYDSLMDQQPWSSNRRPGQAWGLTDLRSILAHILFHIKVPLVIFLDGLDEFEGTEAEVFDIVSRLRHQGNAKICLSSRPMVLFDKYLGHPSLSLQKFNHDSILKYSRDRLDDRCSTMGLDIAKSEISTMVNDFAQQIASEAEGVFLWARFAVDSILEGLEIDDSMDEVRSRLHRLPRDLGDMYQAIWDRICDDNDNLQKAVLNFQLVLTSEMSLLEFYLATSRKMQGDSPISFRRSNVELQEACKRRQRSLIKQCRGLLEVITHETTKEDDISVAAFGKIEVIEHLSCNQKSIKFMHRTAHDWVEAKISGFPSHLIESVDQIHLRLVKVMLNGLLVLDQLPVEDFPSMAEDLNTFNQRYLEETGVSTDACIQAFGFLLAWEEEVISRQAEAGELRYDQYYRFGVASDIIGSLAELGLYRYLEALREIEWTPRVCTYLLGCLLTRAIDLPDIKMLKYLLTKGARPMGNIEPQNGGRKASHSLSPWNIYLLHFLNSIRPQNRRQNQTTADLDQQETYINEMIKFGADSVTAVVAIFVSTCCGAFWMSYRTSSDEWNKTYRYPDSALERHFVVRISPTAVFRQAETWRDGLPESLEAVNKSYSISVELVGNRSEWWSINDEQVSAQFESLITELADLKYPVESQDVSTKTQEVDKLCLHAHKISGAVEHSFTKPQVKQTWSLLQSWDSGNQYEAYRDRLLRALSPDFDPSMRQIAWSVPLDDAYGGSDFPRTPTGEEL
jgi:hypothetical protein